MNVIISLIQKYIYTHSLFFVFLVVMTLILCAIQTNVITKIVANIINSLEHHNNTRAAVQYKWFIYMSLLYLIFNGITKYVQTNLLSNFNQWMRKELITLIIKKNAEELSQVTLVNYATPIFKVSNIMVIVIYDIIQDLITNVAYIVTIGMYFMFYNLRLGSIFLVSNVVLSLYVYYFWNRLMRLKDIDELAISNSENHVIDVLNNFHKVLYRGNETKEINKYTEIYTDSVEKSTKYYMYGITQIQIITLLLYAIVCVSIWYIIKLKISDKINVQLAIAFITIILLYRDQIINIIQQIPYAYGDLIGRVNYATPLLDEMGLSDFLEKTTNDEVSYKDINLNFDKIEFKNVTFKYINSNNLVLNNYTNTILLGNNKIIGINGESGKGKSTLMKLVIRIYKPNQGDILVDGVNIKEINPSYLRNNITFIDQESKLFNNKIINNIMYGCSDEDECYSKLNKIMSSQLIKGLFSGINFIENESGALGANLSGGQRQVINLISGLINPSQILVLDEPTNALDYTLKMEVIDIIKEFSKYKKNIIIISHDKDVFKIYDTKIEV